MPEAFTSVDLELREPILDLPVSSFTLGPEDLASGELELPGVEVDDLYFEHMGEYEALNTFPEELALHAVIVYEKDGAPVTEERDLIARPELGWGVRYWPKDTEKTDWNYPGCFRFGTYESDLPGTPSASPSPSMAVLSTRTASPMRSGRRPIPLGTT